MEVFEHSGNEFRLAAGEIQIFIPQDEDSVVSAGAFLGAPECAGVAEVQKACRRRSQATAIRTHNSNRSLGWSASHSPNPDKANERIFCALAQFTDVSSGRGAPVYSLREQGSI